MIITEKAYAKLNLSLDVLDRRADGYHDMCMIMQSVTLCDELEISTNGSGVISASSTLSYIPGDERNLAVRAAGAFLEAAGETGQGLTIRLKKNIPVGTGMAGGSADAAAVLRALDRMYSDRFSVFELEQIAARVGSDVAFCVAGGTALASGRGEILTELKDMPDCSFVIVKPQFSISTPELFRKLDTVQIRSHPDTPGMLKALEDGDLSSLCRRMYNVFEDCGDRRMRDIGAIKGLLLDYGALGAVMTGTGSAVFGVFADDEKAQTARDTLSSEYRFVRLAKPTGRIM